MGELNVVAHWPGAVLFIAIMAAIGAAVVLYERRHRR